jgi:hypothetical protein
MFAIYPRQHAWARAPPAPHPRAPPFRNRLRMSRVLPDVRIARSPPPVISMTAQQLCDVYGVRSVRAKEPTSGGWQKADASSLRAAT